MKIPIHGEPTQGNYRGRLSNNPFDPESISNSFGRYGNRFSPDSINNPFGAGNPYRYDSPNNPFGEGLTIIGDSGGYSTYNPYFSNQILNDVTQSFNTSRSLDLEIERSRINQAILDAETERLRREIEKIDQEKARRIEIDLSDVIRDDEVQAQLVRTRAQASESETEKEFKITEAIEHNRVYLSQAEVKQFTKIWGKSFRTVKKLKENKTLDMYEKQHLYAQDKIGAIMAWHSLMKKNPYAQLAGIEEGNRIRGYRTEKPYSKEFYKGYKYIFKITEMVKNMGLKAPDESDYALWVQRKNRN